jgi:hypothetical protein
LQTFKEGKAIQGGQPDWLRVVRRQREKMEMAKQKEERNKAFWSDWKQGMSAKELSKKYGLTLESVKSLKKTLKLRYESRG